MTQEIERRFLVDPFIASAKIIGIKPEIICQGYLTQEPERSVRIRISNGGCWLTIKGEKFDGKGAEFEYKIPRDDAAALMWMTKGRNIGKSRYRIPHGDLTIELDIFTSHPHLAIAEIELPSIDHPFEKPDWFGKEITDDHSFSNQSLAFPEK